MLCGCLASLILQPHMGSERFAQLIFILAALSSALVVVIGYTLAEMGYPGPFHQCAAGFSAVLFGLKVRLAVTAVPS